MDICVSHTTSLAWLLTHRNPLAAGLARPSKATSLPVRAPTSEQIQRACALLGISPSPEHPLDVLVGTDRAKRPLPGVRIHVCRVALPAGSLLNAGGGVYLCAPALAFVQGCAALDPARAIYLAYELCASYQREEGSKELHKRPAGERLCNSAQLARFSQRAAHLNGAVLARKAARLALDGSASPRESGLAMLYALPPLRGGFALGAAELNKEIKIRLERDAFGNARTQVRRPDILIQRTDRHGLARSVAIDYDSDDFHSSRRARTRDTARRNELALRRDLAYFAITADQAGNFIALERLAERMRKVLGKRRQRFEDEDAADAQRKRRLSLWRAVIVDTNPLNI